ncbi:hypothetical protein BZA70DRAFT_288617 [Myxozyma melibiosi]|uniref:GRIP domain-containing protein n=1 Tax=Myxozyma melibiosi TaxID=54550 RepID=A0ABR1F8Z5_9ASCO
MAEDAEDTNPPHQQEEVGQSPDAGSTDGSEKSVNSVAVGEEEEEEEQDTPSSSRMSSEMSKEDASKSGSSKEEQGELAEKLAALTLEHEKEKKKSEEEKKELLAKVEAAEKAKSEAEVQYKNLLGKVSHIRSTLGDRLKSDSVEIARQKTNIEYLEQKNKALSETITTLQQEVITASEEADKLSKELAGVRQSSLASQDLLARERDELVAREKKLQTQLTEAERAAEDWKLIAQEEKTMRIATVERAAELEEEYQSLKSEHDTVLKERDDMANNVISLRQAIEVMQVERNNELHDLVEKMQAQIDALTEEKVALSEEVQGLKTEITSTKEDLERMRPFEKEVKEKTLLIGKLRHEAVILNEHLTKALRLLKKGEPDENVNRQLITNLLLSFLSLPRSDTKRFEVLQLIAACLSWNDDQKATAGLIRPGTHPGSAVPQSPLSP